MARQVAYDLADTFVVEDHRHVAWSSEQRQPVPQRQRLGGATSNRSPLTIATANGRNGVRFLNARIVLVNVSRSITPPLIYLLSAIVPAGR